MNYRHSASIFLTLACLAGCGGGGGGSSTSGSAGGGSSTSVTIPPPAPSTVGRIVLNSVLARAIPSTIDTLIFRGLDAQGNAIYGPVTQAKAATIVLENVPIAVRTLEIDYLQTGVVRGRTSQSVQVSAGQDTRIQDPNFQDVTYALTQIRLDPTSVAMRRGQTAPLRVQGSYADNTSADLTESAEWTSSNTSVAECTAGTLVARGIGNCTLTATVGGQSAQASVQVDKPLLQELQITPANATLLEGGRLTYQAVGSFEDGSVETVSDVLWSSNPGAVASITPQGEAQALTPGESLIQATRDGITSNTTLTVAVNQTLTNLQLSPAQIQVPKGMSFSYTTNASYANGTVVDVTDSATFESEDPGIAQTQTAFQPPRLPFAYVIPGNLAYPPPPFFPAYPYEVRGESLGTTRIFSLLDTLRAEAFLTVVAPVPYVGRFTPMETHRLEVGGQLQLETLTGLTDGTLENNRADVSVEVQGNATTVNPQRLLSAVRGGADLLVAALPPLPQLPGPARYSYLANRFEFRERDYSRDPYEQTAVVVNQPQGLSFTAQSETAGIGTLIADSPNGLVGVRHDQVGSGPAGQTAVNVTNITAFAPGNFTNGATRQIFYAGDQSGSWYGTGPNYGVAVRTASPATTTYTNFRDGSVSDAVVADFNGDGKSDAALLIGNQLWVRLTGATPLSELKSTLALGYSGNQIGVGDFNGDQKLDLVIGSAGGLQIWTGDGAGNFAARPLVAATSVTNHLNVADIDGDHLLDVAYMNSEGYGNRRWVVAYGDGQGGLGRLHTGTTGYRVAATRLGDVTGDGRADLVTVQSKSQRTLVTDSDVSVSIHPGSAEGFLPQQVIQISSVRAGADLVLRDANGDGRLDITLALTQPYSNGIFNPPTYNRSSTLLTLLRQP